MGGFSNTAFAAGLERTSKAWADAEGTAHALYITTMTINKILRILIFTLTQ
jgi:hypothetical protein